MEPELSADNMMLDSPMEYLSGMANADGYCIGQSILPIAGGYRCHCSCGNWDVDVLTEQEGLRLARQHTATTDQACR